MQRWQRSLLAVGTAGVLLFALSLHLSTVQPPDAAVDHAPRAGLEALRPIEDGASAASRRFMWPAKRHQPRSRLDAANQEEEPGDAGVILRCKHIPHVQNTMLLSTKDVTIGLYLLNMETTADEPGVFYADFIMFLRQHGQPMHAARLDPWDTLGFANAKQIESMQSFGNARGLRRVQGSFFFSPDFRWYPFDRQRIEITVEQIEYPVTTWVFLPDWHLNGVSSTVRFPGWQSTLRDHGTNLANCGADVDTRALPGAVKMGHSKFSNLTFSTFTYRVDVDRPVAQGVIADFIPPAIIMSPVMFSYLLDPLRQWTIRLSLGGSAVMSLVFFHNAQVGKMPVVDYLTVEDKYIYTVYLFIFSNLVGTISLVVYFRDILQCEQAAVPSGLGESVLALSMRTGYLVFVVLFLALLPLWICGASNYAIIVLLLASIAFVAFWLSAQYSEARLEFGLDVDTLAEKCGTQGVLAPAGGNQE